MTPSPTCIRCNQSEQDVPLLLVRYQGREFWICPQHLPILIHKPALLADRLPGIENVTPPDEGHAHSH